MINIFFLKPVIIWQSFSLHVYQRLILPPYNHKKINFLGFWWRHMLYSRRSVEVTERSGTEITRIYHAILNVRKSCREKKDNIEYSRKYACHQKGTDKQTERNLHPLSLTFPSVSSERGEVKGSHREINIDEAMLPENKPLNYRPRPKSELNLSYSVQVL